MSDIIRQVRRGEIYYVDKFGTQVGSEMITGRPAVIVSNDKNNRFSSTVEVVWLTGQPKTDLPTHVTIRSTRATVSTALCEQITSISKERLGNFMAICTNEEMRQIDAALMISLGINGVANGEEDGADFDADGEQDYEEGEDTYESETSAEMAKIEAERDVYKTLYNELLNKMIGWEAAGE